MSTMGDVLSGIKKMLVFEDKVARMERDMDALADDVSDLRDVISAMNERVSLTNERIVRMETKFEIYEAQASQRRIENR
jgi:predicted  nucleic acid-binding Zn-ribbon protein